MNPSRLENVVATTPHVVDSIDEYIYKLMDGPQFPFGFKTKMLCAISALEQVCVSPDQLLIGDR